MTSERIVVGVQHPGVRPRRPARPRKPREMFWRTESVWSSEDDDILLADLLHLIPSDIKAQRIRISVEKNPNNGYPNVVITYNHEIPNTRFCEQMRDYEVRMKQYDTAISRWSERDAEWCIELEAYESQLQEIRSQLERAFDEHASILEKDAI